MKTIINNKYGFCFEIGEKWEEIKKDNNKNLTLSPSTIHYFNHKNEDGEIEKLTVNMENSRVEGIGEFYLLVEENFRHLKLAFGPEVSVNHSTKYNDNKIEKFYLESPLFNVVVYFTLINRFFVSFAGTIKKENDLIDNEFLEIVRSLKLIYNNL